MTHSGWGVRFIDYDNDGWKDLLINQGHDLDTIQLTFSQPSLREAMLLARNAAKALWMFGGGRGYFSACWWTRPGIGDIDNDGRWTRW